MPTLLFLLRMNNFLHYFSDLFFLYILSYLPAFLLAEQFVLLQLLNRWDWRDLVIAQLRELYTGILGCSHCLGSIKNMEILAWETISNFMTIVSLFAVTAACSSWFKRIEWFFRGWSDMNTGKSADLTIIYSSLSPEPIQALQIPVSKQDSFVVCLFFLYKEKGSYLWKNGMNMAKRYQKAVTWGRVLEGSFNFFLRETTKFLLSFWPDFFDFSLTNPESGPQEKTV